MITMSGFNVADTLIAATGGPSSLKMAWFYLQIFIGFSFIIFIHELGHFVVAKWAGVKVEQFAVGFLREVWGFTRGETRYSFNLLPLGGYVKMLGQEDFEVDTTGELQFTDDPRSFANKSVGKRAAIVSAGVIMNLVLAGALFMIVFLIGKEVQAPRVGAVLPDGPAAIAGIQSGDVIKEIDGTEIDEFFDISMATTLAKPGEPLEVLVDRDGKPMKFLVEPERGGDRDMFQIGITSPHNATLIGVGPEYQAANPHDPHIGDTIVQLGDKTVTPANANAMMNLLLSDPLAYRKVVVDRPIDPFDKDSKTERVDVELRPQFLLQRADMSDNPDHLLGMVPLTRVSDVTPEGRADLAGIGVGDTILQWDAIRYPTSKQITKNLIDSAPADDPKPEKDIPIRVRHADGKVADLVVRPKVKIVPITGKRSKPTIEAQYSAYADDILIVGTVVEEVAGKPSPAFAAGIPAGARITAVAGGPVSTWIDLAEALRVRSGEDVEITYDDGNRTGLTASMKVPHSLLSALGVGPEAVILSIAGEERLLIDEDGNEIPKGKDAATAPASSDEKKPRKRSTRASVGYPIVMRAALAKHVGETVEVKYRPYVLGEAKTAEVTVTEDMLYPWVASMRYTFGIMTAGEKTILRKTNPIDALRVGVRKTYYFIYQVYQVMERMIISRSLGVEQISGPVGIVKMGGAMAERGIADLLFFLAIISANLAVINFLPLPIVDGGLMVFLIIEKIKGSPISMRIQVATQVVGLVLIVTAFLFVTIMDIYR